VPKRVEDLVEDARRTLQRVSPEQAAAELAQGALLVDTRTSEQRARGGEIPGAEPIGLNVLEWRLDPSSGSRIARATGHDIRIIVMCEEGFSSSLAAARLQELGLRNSTDVIGGFQAWRRAGLARGLRGEVVRVDEHPVEDVDG
jgi:rhodanese-related sulfurtransferase